MLTLFERFPQLAEKLPHAALGNFPTPIQHAEKLGELLGLEHLYIKRDDACGALYGGNKVRKLEFLLGYARAKSKSAILTYGYAGSNHATATAVYAQTLGLHTQAILSSQPNAQYVRQNLLRSYAAGSELYYIPKSLMQKATVALMLKYRMKHGSFPLILPAGGSAPRGVIGFVNAAYELKQQIEAGELPEPDRIYVACGTMGTAVGLALGIEALQLKTRVIAVRVIDAHIANLRSARQLFEQTHSFLHNHISDFPVLKWNPARLQIRSDELGGGYGVFSPAAREAIQLGRDYEHLDVDGTYAGKALAALIKDARHEQITGKQVLFWQTRSSVPLGPIIEHLDYRELPEGFHRYFEEVTQDES